MKIPPRKISDIIENYPSHGYRWCRDRYKLSKNQIAGIVRKYGLKLDKTTRSKIASDSKIKKLAADYKVNHEELLNIDSPEKAYVLGLIWTDGHINKNSNTIAFTSTIPDGIEFKNVFLKTGGWSIYIYKTRRYDIKTKTQININTTNKFLKESLIGFDYRNKTVGFGKIYNFVPDKYKHLFIRGVVDGDGCFYVNEKNCAFKFSLCSSFDQNWACLESVLKGLDIDYNIERTKTATGKYSKIHISGRSRVKRFGDYIYRNYDSTDIGLKRKYQKYLITKSNLVNARRETMKKAI